MADQTRYNAKANTKSQLRLRTDTRDESSSASYKSYEWSQSRVRGCDQQCTKAMTRADVTSHPSLRWTWYLHVTVLHLSVPNRDKRESRKRCLRLLLPINKWHSAVAWPARSPSQGHDLIMNCKTQRLVWSFTVFFFNFSRNSPLSWNLNIHSKSQQTGHLSWITLSNPQLATLLLENPWTLLKQELARAVTLQTLFGVAPFLMPAGTLYTRAEVIRGFSPSPLKLGHSCFHQHSYQFFVQYYYPITRRNVITVTDNEVK
jgi:hypothetical protein